MFPRNFGGAYQYQVLADGSDRDRYPPGLPPALWYTGVKVPSGVGGAPGPGEGRALTTQPAASVSKRLSARVVAWPGAAARSIAVSARTPASQAPPCRRAATVIGRSPFRWTRRVGSVSLILRIGVGGAIPSSRVFLGPGP